MRLKHSYWLLFLVPVFAGCSANTGGDVKGSVKIAGKTVTSGTVVIQNESGRTATGSILKDGTFTVIGPPRGKCKVLLLRSAEISSQPPPPIDMTPDLKKVKPPTTANKAPSIFPIPAKYASERTTDIEITISGGSQTLPIERGE